MIDFGFRIADLGLEKNERRTSNVQHRTLNEKQSSFLIGRGRSCEINLFLSLPVEPVGFW